MPSEKLNLDVMHSSVHFWVRHLMVSKVHGRFTKWRGSLLFDERAPQNSQVEIEIDAASVDTGEPQRDAHLRSADVFEVDKYPKLTFESTRIEPVGDSEFKVTGDLTMRDVTKPVTLDVEYAGRSRHERLGERFGFSARGVLNRKEWGLIYNQLLETGGLAVSDKIEIQLEIEATKAG